MEEGWLAKEDGVFFQSTVLWLGSDDYKPLV